MPPAQTSCPANGTARAAVMRPVKLGKHPTIVYVYNEIPQTLVFGSLKGWNPTQFAYTYRGSVDIAGWTTWG
jgi:hypothetical protein